MSRKFARVLVAMVSASACVFLLVAGGLGDLGLAKLWTPLGAVIGIVAVTVAVWPLLPRPPTVAVPQPVLRAAVKVFLLFTGLW